MIEILRWLAILIVAALRERGDLALEIWLATTAGNAEKEEGSPETPQERPRVLGRALWNLAPLAKGLAPGPSGHGGRMVAKRLQGLLGQDFAAQKCGQTGRERGS
jgi:hypothetical protein